MAAAKLKVLRHTVALSVAACLLVVAATAAAQDAASDSAVSESMLVADATTVESGMVVSVSEGIGIGDGAGVLAGEVVAVGEGLAIGDGTATVTGARVDSAETVGIGDGTNVVSGQRVDVEEGVAIGDGTDAQALNVVPVVALTPFSGAEGAAATSTGSFVDSNPGQQWTAVVDYGDGSGANPLPLAQDKTFALSHVYDDSGSYVVTVTVNDNAGGSGTATAAVTIDNVAPVATLANAGPVQEGAPVTVSFADQHDDSGADTAAGFTYRYACDGQNFGTETPNASTSCTFDDNGTHAVLARIADKDGDHTEYSTDVVVTNVAPTAQLGNDGPVAEGAPATVSFSTKHDPSAADTAAGFTYRYACDGSVFGPITSDPTSTCTFDEGPSEHTVLARILDKDGSFTDYTTAVEVENSAPDGSFGNNGPVSEGAGVTVGWSGQSDPSPVDTAAGFTYRYACDGQTFGTATSSATATCTFDDGPSTHTVASRILDEDGGFTERATVVVVENAAPTATFVVPTTSDEGATFNLALVDAVDASDADSAAGFELEYDCGLGGGYQTSPACTAVENALQAVKARIRDKDGGTTEYSATVPIANVAPSVTITGPPAGSVYRVGEPVLFTGTFTDPGVQDTHTATWRFDAVDSAGTVNEGNGSGSTSVVMWFPAAGVYSVRLTVTDDDGASGTASTVGGLDAFVVVYDPTAGFVTGGGWIDSPAGAYPPDPNSTGKATFGFVSRYAKGATVPSGNTEFRFHAAKFTFSSTSYEWLVIAGKRAQYKGAGSVNGVPGYKFMLTAVDESPDRLRMKISDASGELVYDNVLGASDDADDPGMQAIGGGSIVIHR